jgi:sugar lactone lactonase YvrE
LLIDAEGCLRAMAVGQDGIVEMEKLAAQLCDALPPSHDDDRRALVEARPEPRLPLRFPAGLAASADRLFVADSGHHRILECTHHGRVLRQFGMGSADFLDGDAELAAFRHPQAVTLGRESLYVVDTGNHALRRISLGTGHVDTLCGSGRAGQTVAGAVDVPRNVSLNQPVAAIASDRQLFFAQAGDNCIWNYDLGRNRLELLGGTGQLELRDGSGALAAFAQPVGLAMVQQTLYVCDALASAVRSLQVRTVLVQTLVGHGLWDFGNVDGARETALLQYPQAVALAEGSPLLWIADAGNGHLRTLRLGGGEVATVNLPRPLNGPAGLAVAGGKVWIAETNAHAVLKYDMATGALEHVPIDE